MMLGYAWHQRSAHRPMVEIVPYKSKWPTEFQEIALILRQGLGDLALRIDHIGSTSVPGLAAKDVIDIQITVAALDQEVLSAIRALGYSQPEGLWRDHRPARAEDRRANGKNGCSTLHRANAPPTPTCRCRGAQPALRALVSRLSAGTPSDS